MRAFVPEQIHVAFGNYSDSMVVMWAAGLEISCHVTYWQAISEIKQKVGGKSVSVMEDITYSYRAELMVSYAT